jgi:hypothetical protein
MLGDRPAIAATLQDAGVPIGELQSALDKAGTKSQQLADDAEVANHLRDLIDRVQLESGGIRVSLSLKRLIEETNRYRRPRRLDDDPLHTDRDAAARTGNQVGHRRRSNACHAL